MNAVKKENKIKNNKKYKNQKTIVEENISKYVN